MAKDILLIGHFGQYQTLYFFDQLNEATKENQTELVLRVNSSGGYPEEASSIIEKAQEIIDQILAVKGAAQLHSTALFLMAYFPVEKCECLDVTQGVLHRAAYDERFESSEGFKGSPYEQIMVKLNKDMERALRARVDVDALEALPQMKASNITVKSIFDLTSRISVVLTGADMKKIGLVSKVNKITPSKVVAMNAEFEAFEKCESLKDYRLAAKAVDKSTDKNEDPTPTNMTLEELKLKYPAIYAEAKKEGVSEEKDRVEAIMVFNDIDPTGVKAAIESGKPMTAKQMAEFSRKSMNASVLTAAAADSAEEVETETNVDEEEQIAADTAKKEKAKPGLAKPKPVKAESDKKKIQEFEDSLDARLGLKKAS